MTKLNVLVLCECSGVVSQAFRDLGHHAYSVDTQDCDATGDSEYHIKGDALEVLDNFYQVSKGSRVLWDLIIMHPPCTALAVSGNAHYGDGQAKYDDRLVAAIWTLELWTKALERGKHVALENPVSVLHRLTGIPKASYVQPYEHGHAEQKKTGFHLHDLPAIVETDNVKEAMMLLPMKDRQRVHYMSPSIERAKERSRTYTGIAKAIADQWSKYVIATDYTG